MNRQKNSPNFFFVRITVLNFDESTFKFPFIPSSKNIVLINPHSMVVYLHFIFSILNNGFFDLTDYVESDYFYQD